MGTILIFDKTIYFYTNSHLGDILDTLLFLENYGKLHNKKMFVLNNNNTVASLFALFDYQYINLIKKSSDYIFNLTAQNILWDYFKDANIPIFHPFLKNNIVSKNKNTILAQFDTRSPSYYKPPLKNYEIKKAIIHFASNKQIICVGGFDTKKYLGENFEYRLGNLDYLINQIASCSLFIGCDSGLCRIAGMINVPAKIVTLFLHQRFKLFYNRMYPSIECFPREYFHPKHL